MGGNILVTGGAGFIGSHTCKLLYQSGYTPVVYDNLVYGNENAVKWGPLEKGDLLEKDKLDKLLKTYKPEAVIHFAAYAYVGESVTEPAKYYNNNIAGTLSLLEAMNKNNIKKIIFSSTCATYGIPSIVPISENHPQNPINPYGFSKLVVEQMLRDFDKAYGIKSISLRYFNAAGSDPDNEIGENHFPETHLIPLVLDAACGRRSHIDVFGDDYDTPDGTCVRDYIHVMDLASAHLLSLEKLTQEGTTSFYNLGNGKGYSVKEVIEIAEKITKRKILVKMSSRRAGDPPVLIGDAGKANLELGWKQKFPELGSQIQHAWNWYKKTHNIEG